MLLPLQGEGCLWGRRALAAGCWEPSGTVLKVESHPFPGTSVKESTLGGSWVLDTAGRAQHLKRTVLEVVMFLLNLLGHCPRPCQVTLPERCANTASARSLETRFPPSSVADFLGDPKHRASGYSFPRPASQSLLFPT